MKLVGGKKSKKVELTNGPCPSLLVLAQESTVGQRWAIGQSVRSREIPGCDGRGHRQKFWSHLDDKPLRGLPRPHPFRFALPVPVRRVRRLCSSPAAKSPPPDADMYRAALRSSAPSALRAVRPATLAPGSRRLLSTAPAKKKGTWKGTVVRWGLAAAAVYFYNTSPIFADELPRKCAPCAAVL